ncbi:complement factor D-like [Anopheles stephensi]|uniref:complement factor D-like n=1 Tax=Anopheles stephensi TaxID=30069 RepID=UPI0016588CA5|nr:complement factor D-like [Anopheles stephensi]
MPVSGSFRSLFACVALLCTVGFGAEEQRSGRIVGGRNADIKDHPHMLLLRKNGYATCGAVVIGAKYALTAAHCVYPASNTSTISLHGGSTTQTGPSVQFAVERFMVHPKYSESGNDNDIAIIEISDEFSDYRNVQPIALQDIEPSTLAGACNVTGWGVTNTRTYAVSNTLQVGTLQLISPRTCRLQWHPSTVTVNMICARGEAADACAGDSGGPLVCGDRLYGLVSWGTMRCDRTKPAVFTKIFASGIRAFIKVNSGI